MTRSTPPISALFDKGVIRKTYEYQRRLLLNHPPTVDQENTALAFSILCQYIPFLYITQETVNVLALRPRALTAPIISNTKPLAKARYHRRWARRLRDYGFTAEDAVVISYGSFGVDKDRRIIGVDVIITTDLRLIRNFRANLSAIHRRFHRMTHRLSEPYAQATVPDLLSIAEALKQLSQF